MDQHYDTDVFFPFKAVDWCHCHCSHTFHLTVSFALFFNHSYVYGSMALRTFTGQAFNQSVDIICACNTYQKTLMDMSLQNEVPDFEIWANTLKSRIARSNGNSIFISELIVVFHGGSLAWTDILLSHQQCKSVQLLPFLINVFGFLLLFCFDSCHCTGHKRMCYVLYMPHINARIQQHYRSQFTEQKVETYRC